MTKKYIYIGESSDSGLWEGSSRVVIISLLITDKFNNSDPHYIGLIDNNKFPQYCIDLWKKKESTSAGWYFLCAPQGTLDQSVLPVNKTLMSLI